jgi:uncharacterized protein
MATLGSRLRVTLVGAALAASALGCGGSEIADPSPVRVGRTVERAPSGTLVAPEGFEVVTVTVTDAEGRTRTFCLLLAATPGDQRRGFMHVTDPELGGYDGMAFVYEADTAGGFWMRNTRLPLSIAWIRADGTTVSMADMEPCPDDAETCPTYEPAGPYRLAIEVPRGGLGDLGISDRSVVALGERGRCHTPR